ncbi:MAG: glycosyl hydrolase family 28-related protein, partial [Bacteroidia bacterium]
MLFKNLFRKILSSFDRYALSQGEEAPELPEQIEEFPLYRKNTSESLKFYNETGKQYTPIRYVWSIKDFGATGDGKTDDTEAIQRALNVVDNQGRAIFIPAGKYKISSTLKIKSNTYLYGEGHASLFIRDEKVVSDSLQLFYSLNVKNVTVENFAIDMNNLQTTSKEKKSFVT